MIQPIVSFQIIISCYNNRLQTSNQSKNDSSKNNSSKNKRYFFAIIYSILIICLLQMSFYIRTNCRYFFYDIQSSVRSNATQNTQNAKKTNSQFATPQVVRKSRTNR